MTVTAAEPIKDGRPPERVADKADANPATPAPAVSATQQRPAQNATKEPGQPTDRYEALPKRDKAGHLVGVQIPLRPPTSTDGARTPSSTPGARQVERVGDPPGAAPATAVGGPTQAAIDAALDRGTAPGASREGADAAADAEFRERWEKAQRGAGTAGLIQQRLVSSEVLVPANEREGVQRLTEIRRQEVERFLSGHPDMAKVLEEDFNRRFSQNDRGNFRQFMDFVVTQVARQDWTENRVGADRNGEVRVAMLGAEAIIARARDIGERATKDPQHFSPVAGSWLAFVLDKVRNEPHCALAQTLNTATTTTIMNYGVGQGVREGVIEADATPQQLEQRLRAIHADAGQRLQAAGGPPPAELPPVVVENGHATDPRNPPLISYRDYRRMANEAIQNTLDGRGDRVVFHNPNGGAPYAPSREQMTQFLASPQAQENYYSSDRAGVQSTPNDAVLAGVGPSVGDLEHSRSAQRRAEELQQALFNGGVRQRATHVADLDLARRKRRGAVEERQNRVQSALNLGDPRGLSEGAAANRAISRNS